MVESGVDARGSGCDAGSTCCGPGLVCKSPSGRGCAEAARSNGKGEGKGSSEAESAVLKTEIRYLRGEHATGPVAVTSLSSAASRICLCASVGSYLSLESSWSWCCGSFRSAGRVLLQRLLSVLEASTRGGEPNACSLIGASWASRSKRDQPSLSLGIDSRRSRARRRALGWSGVSGRLGVVRGLKVGRELSGLNSVVVTGGRGGDGACPGAPGW